MSAKYVAFFLFLVTPTLSVFVQNELNNVTKRDNPSATEWTEQGIFSSLLEEWTLSNR